MRIISLDGNARRDTRIILIRSECPYVQFGSLMFLHSFCSRELQIVERERRAPKSLAMRVYGANGSGLSLRGVDPPTQGYCHCLRAAFGSHHRQDDQTLSVD